MRASIIIPMHNAEETVGETINSALAQTYNNVEVIVVDDGSADNSRLVAMEFGGRIRLICQHNYGVAIARNTGALKSYGDVILPLDADDLIDPTYLEKTIPLMTYGVGIVSTDMQRFGEVNDRIEPRISTWRSNDLPVTSLISRRAFFEILGYDDTIMYEDWDLWLRILKNGWKVAILNEPLFHYRVRKNTRNEMQNRDREKYLEQIRIRHR